MKSLSKSKVDTDQRTNFAYLCALIYAWWIRKEPRLTQPLRFSIEMSLGDDNFSVMVAVITAWAVQMSRYYVINMIAMGNRFVSAVGSVLVRFFMTLAGMIRCAVACVGAGLGQTMLIYMIVMDVMEMAIMQIIFVLVVLDGRMSTSCSMLVFVIGVSFTVHSLPPSAYTLSYLAPSAILTASL